MDLRPSYLRLPGATDFRSPNLGGSEVFASKGSLDNERGKLCFPEVLLRLCFCFLSLLSVCGEGDRKLVGQNAQRPSVKLVLISFRFN